ncbi:peptidoglycan DD-metalloendopeptidase family protein [Candidatus Dependentiae bacterium]|nr:peptidoglycan DD-metalloendopeptidase family protein [Candidatus Dependentiae bacterium]
MLKRFKIPFIVIITLFVIFWVGSSIFNYFTHNVIPEIIITGIEREGFYSGVIQGNIKSNNSYKIAQVRAFLDGEEINLDCPRQIGNKKFNIPFKIDTNNLLNGLHILEIEAIDSSYNQNKSNDKLEFFVDNIPLKATFLQQEYRVDQGHTVHLRIQANKKIADVNARFLEKIYSCYPESENSKLYECFIPIDCEQNADEYILTVELFDKVKNNIKLTGKIIVNAVNFPRQKGFKIAKGKLEEEKEISMSNKILEDALEKWIQDSSRKKLWRGKFEIPIELQRVATPFGEIRTTSEKGRYLHKAVDILNHPKSVVWASQDGKIIIKDRFLLTGNTVAIDHGVGVITLYCHLEDFADIEVGDFVKKGNPIGRLGMTGYANGYHLHWELRVNNVSVDPFEWTKKVF